MKTLSENYASTHANTHETFADLVFCALVVLILFVLVLTVEVSQRVRATMAAVEPISKVTAEEVATLTPEEIEDLSEKLTEQQAEIKSLRAQMTANVSKVRNQLAAMAGEQRFTGAREPAAFHIAYDYERGTYYFVPAKDVNSADRQMSGETNFEFALRKKKELAETALAVRKQRAFSRSEVNAIYSAISHYKMVVPTRNSYRIDDEHVGLYYHILLCKYLVGELSSEVDRQVEVENGVLAIATSTGPKSNEMYPKCRVVVDLDSRTLTLGGVRMAPREFRALLLSMDGRGLMLDFEGFDGAAPRWLYQEALAPAGYISKTPRLPNE